MYDLLIQNGLCVTPEGAQNASVAVLNGKIAALNPSGEIQARRTVDAAGMLVLPGILDTHVHLPWPSVSFDSVDTFATGSRGAAFGGVTTLVEYAVPDENGRILPALEKQLVRASSGSLCDYSFHVILRKITPQNLDEMEDAVALGFPSFKLFTAYSGFRLEDREVQTALERATAIGALICVHAEDGALVNESTARLTAEGKTGIAYYPDAHPRQADINATRKVIELAGQAGARLHIVHVNSKEGARMIRDAREHGVRVTGETCPQYLTFTSEVYKSGQPSAAYFILAPAIREDKEDSEVLWEALASGSLQTLATDHCPYSVAQKTAGGDDFRKVPGGAGGVETSLPLMYTLGVKGGKISLERMVEIMSTNPAKIFNLYPRKGVIAPGSDADLVIFDPDAPAWEVQASGLHSAMDHTIYEGMAMAGRVVSTLLRGEFIVENGRLVCEEPRGAPLRRAAYPA